jgi:hypothetical protein
LVALVRCAYGCAYGRGYTDALTEERSGQLAEITVSPFRHGIGETAKAMPEPR